MRILSHPRPFTILIGCLLALIPCACSEKGTEPKEQMNPYLKFLTHGHPIDGFDSNLSTEFPVWSLDGSKIYYLNVAGFWQYGYTYSKKQIWEIDTSGVNTSLLFEGNFICLNISPDGTTLATNIDRSTVTGFPGGTPALIDLATGAIDTLVIDTALRSLYLEFTPSGDSLMYYATFLDSLHGNWMTQYYWGAFYAYDLIDRTHHQLFLEDPSLVAGFAITRDGKQIIAAGRIRNIDGSEARPLLNVGVWPTLSASGDTIVSGFGPWLLRSTTVAVTDLVTESKLKNIWLLNGGQYVYVYAEFRLSPDGKQLALCQTLLLPGGSGLDFSIHYLYLLTKL